MRRCWKSWIAPFNATIIIIMYPCGFAHPLWKMILCRSMDPLCCIHWRGTLKHTTSSSRSNGDAPSPLTLSGAGSGLGLALPVKQTIGQLWMHFVEQQKQCHWRDDIVGQQGAIWTRTAKDRESWRTLAEGYFLQWKDTAQNRINRTVETCMDQAACMILKN